MTQAIRVRASIAVVHEGRILLTPHIRFDRPILWHIPGGGVDFCEGLRDAAERELLEETGIIAKAYDVLHVAEAIEKDTPYHGISITFRGHLLGGNLRAEDHPIYGRKEPQWFSYDTLPDNLNRPHLVRYIFHSLV